MADITVGEIISISLEELPDFLKKNNLHIKYIGPDGVLELEPIQEEVSHE